MIYKLLEGYLARGRAFLLETSAPTSGEKLLLGDHAL